LEKGRPLSNHCCSFAEKVKIEPGSEASPLNLWSHPFLSAGLFKAGAK